VSEKEPCGLDRSETQSEREALHQDRNRFRHFAAYLLQTRESERWHVARELNDEIGQSLAAAKLNLQSILNKDRGTQNADLIQVTLVLEDSLERVGKLSRNLRPPQLDLLGLGATLKWYLRHELVYEGLEVAFHDESQGIRLDWQIETACFRVVQEALINVSRHARARHVNIALRRDKRHLHLRIEDDGKGFDLHQAGRANGLGLLTMEEGVVLTGGEFKIDSVIRRGTLIHAMFPLRLATPKVRKNKRAPS
jgi:two-component system, NarL family, sensor histidine kinase UhpB